MYEPVFTVHRHTANSPVPSRSSHGAIMQDAHESVSGHIVHDSGGQARSQNAFHEYVEMIDTSSPSTEYWSFNNASQIGASLTSHGVDMVHVDCVCCWMAES
mmetsp:Transcript_69742/g.110840  ORF Transcript_69742/g.110840 Transcript_69742/m.110840 type:complete len:102 (-) Transcript_69742:311-616(-)